MNENDVSKNLESRELGQAQTEGVAGGDMCSAEDLVTVTSSLIEAYENLVDFTSHVIERVAGQ